VAATNYTTTASVTLATLAATYDGIASIFHHLAAVKRQQNVNIIMSAIVLNGDNTITFTFTNALPVNAEQLLHLGVVQT
jgi:hypothetical protein